MGFAAELTALLPEDPLSLFPTHPVAYTAPNTAPWVEDAQAKSLMASPSTGGSSWVPKLAIPSKRGYSWWAIITVFIVALLCLIAYFMQRHRNL